jgi:cytoskeletal protein CcmA (bactofilin family)
VGDLFFEGDLRVTGTVEGSLEATGDVEIDGGGKVNGPVTARHKLVVGPSGSLTGDVRVERLIVQDGANFSGNVSMVKAGSAQKPARPAAAPPPAVAPAPAAPPVAPAAPEAVKATQPSPRATKPPQPKGRRR